MFFVRFSVFYIAIFFNSQAFAFSIEEAIISAKQQSTEVQIEERKSELASLSKVDATTMFLPNVGLEFNDGDRQTITSTNNYDLKEKSRTFTFNQPIFKGFQGVSRFKEAAHKSDAAKESLKAKKSDIALVTAESYIAILKLRKIVEIEKNEIVDYKKILELAKQRLLLKDISFTEYNGYETKSQNIILEAEKNKFFLKEYELRFENLVKEKAENLTKPVINSEFEGFETTIATAITDNPKIKSARYSLKAAKSSLTAESGKILPTLSFLLQKQRQKSSYYFGGSSVNSDAAYLNLNIPLFQSGSEYSSIAKSYKQKQIADLEHKLAIEEVEKQIKEEYLKFLSLRNSVETFLEVLNNAKKSLNLAEDRFRKKDIDLIEFLLKKSEVAELEKHFISTEGDMFYSYFTIKSLIGEL